MDFQGGTWEKFLEESISSSTRIIITNQNPIFYRYLKLQVDSDLKRNSWYFAGYLSFLLSNQGTELGDRQNLVIGEKIFAKPTLLGFYQIRVVAPYFWRQMNLTAYGLVNQFSLFINCGGSSFTDSNGRVWLADQYRIRGGTYVTNVSNIQDPELYTTESFDFAYQIPIFAGRYRISLYFQEFGDAGLRVFNLSLNDQQVLTNFIIASEGTDIPIIKTFDLDIDGNSLTISSESIAGYPSKINAIAIVSI